MRQRHLDQLPVYGCGKGLVKGAADAEKLVRRMVAEGLLIERTERNEQHGGVIANLMVRGQTRGGAYCGVY